MVDSSSSTTLSGYQSTSAAMGPQHTLHTSLHSREEGGQTVQVDDAAAQYSSRTSDSCSNTTTCSTSTGSMPQTATAVVDDDTDASSFSQFAHSSRTNLQSLMNSAPPKAIDWTALHAEQLRHYGRLTERRSSESLRSQMDLLHAHGEGQGEEQHGPGQNASWGEHNANTNDRPSAQQSQQRMNLASASSSSANAFLSILNSSPTSAGGATATNTALPTTNNGTSVTASTSTLYGRGGLTLNRRPSSKALSSSSSSMQLQHQRGTAGAPHQSQPSLSRDRSDQWLDYRRRLEAATGVPMVTSKRGSAGGPGLGLTRSASKRGLVLSKSTSRSNLTLSKSTGASRSNLLVLAGRASQSSSARSLGSQTSATSASTGMSLTPSNSMYVAVATGSEASANMIRASSFCKKMSLKDTPLK